jgi:hypothetical protein
LGFPSQLERWEKKKGGASDGSMCFLQFFVLQKWPSSFFYVNTCFTMNIKIYFWKTNSQNSKISPFKTTTALKLRQYSHVVFFTSSRTSWVVTISKASKAPGKVAPHSSRGRVVFGSHGHQGCLIDKAPDQQKQ